MYKNHFFLILIISITSIFSCTKNVEEQAVIESSDQTTVTYSYSIDGEVVDEEAVNYDDPALNIGITGEEDPSGNLTVFVQAFTSPDKYISWGEENDFPVKLSLEIEEHLRSYAQEEGIIDIYEETNEVPESYLAYEKAYYERMTGNEDSSESRAIYMLHKNCSGGSASPLIHTLPVMWFGWNNQVSRYYPFSIYSGLIIYDNSFYRNRLATLWNWGWTNYCLPPGLDNRMSSALTI